VSLDVLLLILRMITGALLLAFLGGVFLVLWRDYQAAARTAAAGQRQRGRLVVVRADDAAIDAAGDGKTTEFVGSPAETLAPVELVGVDFPLLPLTSLGRGPTNTIVLNDTFCSQDHALVTWRGGQWWLEDRHSSNGTLLNGELITGPVVVSSGDVIGIGRIALKVELG
jgi:hypothetical protein